MNRTLHERIKFYMLIFFVITSIIQVGILWNYQGQGLPTSFLFAFFSSNNIKDNTANKAEYFRPIRIIASEGFDEPHWILNSKHSEYNRLWSDAKFYLTQILGSNGKISKVDYTDDKWGDLAVERAFVFEFSTVINKKIIKNLMQISSVSDDAPNGILKIALLPFEDVNDNVVIYISDGNSIYKYICPINSNCLSKKQYDTIMDGFSIDKTIFPFSVVKEVVPDNSKALFKIRPDIPVVVEGDKYREEKSIIYTVPEIIANTNTNTNSDLLKLSNVVLNKDKDSYDFGVDIYGSVVFKNFNNIYRINKNGNLEYRYLSDLEDSDKGEQADALDKAISFIANLKGIINDVDIFLTGIEEQKTEGYYTFKFNYYIGEHPVFFEEKEATSIKYKDAITISANSKRVIKCQWILGSFKQVSSNKILNMNFEDLLEDTFKIYNNLNYENFSVHDINVAYVLISRDTNIKGINPSWVIKTMNNENYVVPMREKKGD